MENNHLERAFQHRLHDAEVPPPPFVWPSLERELKKKQRRRFAFWLFAIGLLTAVGSSGAWLAYSLLKRPTVQNETLPTTAENGQGSMPTATNPSTQTQPSGGPLAPIETTAAFGQPSKPAPAATFKAKLSHSAQQQAAAPIEAKAQPIAVQSLEKGDQAEAAQMLAAKYLTETLPLGNLPQSLRAGLDDRRLLPTPQTFKATGHRKTASPPKVCYDFARHPSAWMLDAYFGPSLARRTLSSTSDGNNYLKQRLSTERSSAAFGAGLRGSLLFNRNYLVRTGLNYDQFTEIFEYVDPTYVKYKIEVTIVNGQTKIDTVGVEYGENYLKTYNRYGMLDVPLMLGVEMRKGRTGVSINAGFSANVLFFNRGAIIDPVSLEPARFGQDKAPHSDDVFRTSVGLSATASVQWYWHLTRNLRVFAEPSFRQVLRPITLETHPVEQRYTIFGLRFGATHIF